MPSLRSAVPPHFAVPSVAFHGLRGVREATDSRPYLFVCFTDTSSTNPADWLDHFDCDNAHFMGNLSALSADTMEFGGFDTSPVVAAEQIDRVIICAHAAGYVRKIWFKFTHVAQLEALFNNVREMPKTVKRLNLVIDFAGQTSMNSAQLIRALNRSHLGLERRTLGEGLSVYLDVIDVPDAIILVELFVDVSSRAL